MPGNSIEIIDTIVDDVDVVSYIEGLIHKDVRFEKLALEDRLLVVDHAIDQAILDLGISEIIDELFNNKNSTTFLQPSFSEQEPVHVYQRKAKSNRKRSNRTKEIGNIATLSKSHKENGHSRYILDDYSDGLNLNQTRIIDPKSLHLPSTETDDDSPSNAFKLHPSKKQNDTKPSVLLHAQNHFDANTDDCDKSLQAISHIAMTAEERGHNRDHLYDSANSRFKESVDGSICEVGGRSETGSEVGDGESQDSIIVADSLDQGYLHRHPQSQTQSNKQDSRSDHHHHNNNNSNNTNENRRSPPLSSSPSHDLGQLDHEETPHLPAIQPYSEEERVVEMGLKNDDLEASEQGASGVVRAVKQLRINPSFPLPLDNSHQHDPHRQHQHQHQHHSNHDSRHNHQHQHQNQHYGQNGDREGGTDGRQSQRSPLTSPSSARSCEDWGDGWGGEGDGGGSPLSLASVNSPIFQSLKEESTLTITITATETAKNTTRKQDKQLSMLAHHDDNDNINNNSNGMEEEGGVHLSPSSGSAAGVPRVQEGVDDEQVQMELSGSSDTENNYSTDPFDDFLVDDSEPGSPQKVKYGYGKGRHDNQNWDDNNSAKYGNGGLDDPVVVRGVDRADVGGRRVTFCEDMVSDTFLTRYKYTSEEIQDMFYNRRDAMKFEMTYELEHEKAQILGVDWSTYMKGLTEEEADILEKEAIRALGMSSSGDDYDNENEILSSIGSRDSNHSNDGDDEEDDIF